jgi:ketosteroid isomerase-like protein
MTDTSALGPAALAIKKAFETGDRSDFVALLAPTATTWHSSDNVAAETKRTGTNPIPDMIDNPVMDITRYMRFDGGEVLQFTLRGQAKKTGRDVAAYMAIVFTITEAGITRLDEYIDASLGAQLADD